MFRTGLDTNTWSFSLYLRKTAQTLWVPDLVIAKLYKFRKSTYHFWAFVVYKIKELDKVIGPSLFGSFFFSRDYLSWI